MVELNPEYEAVLKMVREDRSRFREVTNMSTECVLRMSEVQQEYEEKLPRPNEQAYFTLRNASMLLEAALEASIRSLVPEHRAPMVEFYKSTTLARLAAAMDRVLMESPED